MSRAWRHEEEMNRVVAVGEEREFWLRMYGQDLDDDDVSEIRRNVVLFFGVLFRINARVQDTLGAKAMNREGQGEESPRSTGGYLCELGGGMERDG